MGAEEGIKNAVFIIIQYLEMHRLQEINDYCCR